LKGNDSVEEIAAKNYVDFIDVINENQIKPVAPAMQWLQASSAIVEYNWLPEVRK